MTTALVRSRATYVYRYLQSTLDEDRLRQSKQKWQARGLTSEEKGEQIHQVDLFFCELIREADELRANLL